MNIIEKIWEGWKVEEEIGRGSYGTVYKCFKEENGVKEYSAIKVISVPQNEYEISEVALEKMSNEQLKEYYKEIADDLVKEIEILRALKGTKYVVEIYDAEVVEKEDGIGWYILIRMELLTAFNTYAGDKKFTETEVIKLGLDLSNALSVCHKAKIIHRDVKPENIFVDDAGNFKLGDFGVAKQMEKTQGSMSIKGTYYYMSPEVFSGKKGDGRADMYSLALVMYKLLNNDRLPFYDPNKQIVRYSERQAAFEKRIKGEELPAIEGISKELNAVILKACSFKSTDRQKNIDEFSAQLEKIVKGQKVRKKPKKSTVIKALSAILAVAVLITSCSLWYGVSEMGWFEERVVTEVEDPSVISIGANETGLTRESIDNKYLYKDEDGLFVFDRTTNETILVTDESEISAAFDGENVLYAKYVQLSEYDPQYLKYSWNLFNLETQYTKEVAGYYENASTDIVYFNDEYVMYKSYDNREQRTLETFSFKTNKPYTHEVSINETILLCGDYVVCATGKEDSHSPMPLLAYKTENLGRNLLSSRCYFDERSFLFKNDYIYFFECTSEEGCAPVFDLYKYNLNNKDKKLLFTFTDNIAGSVVALNEKYVCFDTGGYCLLLTDENRTTSVKFDFERGYPVDCFTNPELTDKIIMLFKNKSKYQYYEVLESGKLKLLGEIICETPDVKINKDMIYSVDGTDEKTIKIYDMQYK